MYPKLAVDTLLSANIYITVKHCLFRHVYSNASSFKIVTNATQTILLAIISTSLDFVTFAEE